MADALIGYTGYVGSTLLRQRGFDALYRSTDIAQIRGREFDCVICAGAPAKKWIANRDPLADRTAIDALIDPLRELRCRHFVLISTVDVFADPAGVDEDSLADHPALHPYGLHRRMLERFVAAGPWQATIVRLPGLVGPGLRKNAIFDLLNGNQVEKIDPRAVYQFYPMVRLRRDLEIAVAAGLPLVHLTAEPVSMAEIAREAFSLTLAPGDAASPPCYDFRTRHAAAFGGNGHYQYSRRESLLAAQAYAQTEPLAERFREAA